MGTSAGMGEKRARSLGREHSNQSVEGKVERPAESVGGGQSGKTCIVSWCLAFPSLRCSFDGAGGGWVLRLRFHHENYPIKAVDRESNGGKKSIIRDPMG